jgi:eukaryotic-like serine/threonine-protein kinase
MPLDVSDFAAARVGTAINDKYRLVRLIGSGGMASVYEGVHRNNGLNVAIKMLHPHLSIDADLRKRFLDEGYKANKVRHRGAVRVLDNDVATDGSVFLVMELLEGETVDARCQRSGSRLELREVCELAAQLLEALIAAHEQPYPIVHRDIKPENLFLTRDGVLKILDFGIARLHEPGGAQAVTRTGRMIGTPAFMPPEQALGRSAAIGPRTDLWAVGATMFTMASGQYVHLAETMEEMLVFAASRPARPLAAVVPHAPPPVAAVVDKALAFAKEDRWPDARTMRAALAEAYAKVYGAALPGAAPPPPQRSGGIGPTVDDPRGGWPAPAPTAGPATEVPATEIPATEIPATEAWRGPGFGPAFARGISTTAGMARSRSGPEPAARPRRLTPARVIGASSLGLALAAAAIAPRVLRSRDAAVIAPASLASPQEPSSPPQAPARVEAPSPPPGSVAIAPPTPPSSPDVPAPPSHPPPSPRPTKTGSPTTLLTTSPPTPPPESSPPPSPPAPSVPPQQPAPPPASATPPPAPTCRAVPYFDSEGHKRFRQECR